MGWARGLHRTGGSILAATFLLVVAGGAALGRDVVLRVGSEGGSSGMARRVALVGSACPEIEDFPAAGVRRLYLELVILCNAFRAGGREVAFAFVDHPNYARTLVETVAGRLDLPSQTVWSTEIEEHREALLASPPVIRPGEWTVGLFTTADRPDVLAVREPGQLRELVGTAPRNWVEDWRALTSLGLKEVVDAPDEAVWKLISTGRADFSPYAFSPAPDMGWQLDAAGPVRLLPIPGMKLALPGSRHFVLSRATPGAEGLMADLARGLERLHARGAIRRLLEAASVLEPRVCGWRLVNPAPTAAAAMAMETIDTNPGCDGHAGDTSVP